MRISAWIVSQQQYALPRSVNPSRNNIESATIQLLSLVFGSAAVVLVADLGLDGVDALVMVTVVLVAVVVVVFNVEAAGFTAGSAPACPAAGSVEPTGSPVPPPGTSFPSVSPLRRRGTLGFNHHMRSRVLADIRHAACTKGTTSVHHKSRGHKRPAQASNAAIGTGCSKPRGIDRKPTAGRTIAKTCVLQTHTINAHARFGSAPMASPEKLLSSRWSASVQTQPRPDALRA